MARSAFDSGLRDRQSTLPDKPINPEFTDQDFRAALSSRPSALRMGVGNFGANITDAVGAVGGAFGAEKFAEEQALEAQTARQNAARLKPEIFDVEDVQSLSDVPAFVGNNLLAQAPNLAATFATRGPVGAAVSVASKLGKGFKTASKLVDVVKRGKEIDKRVERAKDITSLGVSATLGAGEAQGQLQAAEGDKSTQERSVGALVTGGLSGALDALPGIALLKQFGLDKGAKRSVRAALGRIGAAGAGTAVSEGMTEGAQETAQLAAVRWAEDNADAITPDELRQVRNATITGFAVGGSLSTGVSAVQEIGNRGMTGLDRRIEKLRAQDEDNEADTQIESVRAARGLNKGDLQERFALRTNNIVLSYLPESLEKMGLSMEDFNQNIMPGIRDFAFGTDELGLRSTPDRPKKAEGTLAEIRAEMKNLFGDDLPKMLAVLRRVEEKNQVPGQDQKGHAGPEVDDEERAKQETGTGFGTGDEFEGTSVVEAQGKAFSGKSAGKNSDLSDKPYQSSAFTNAVKKRDLGPSSIEKDIALRNKDTSDRFEYRLVPYTEKLDAQFEADGIGEEALAEVREREAEKILSEILTPEQFPHFRRHMDDKAKGSAWGFLRTNYQAVEKTERNVALPVEETEFSTKQLQKSFGGIIREPQKLTPAQVDAKASGQKVRGTPHAREGEILGKDRQGKPVAVGLQSLIQAMFKKRPIREKESGNLVTGLDSMSEALSTGLASIINQGIEVDLKQLTSKAGLRTTAFRNASGHVTTVGDLLQPSTVRRLQHMGHRMGIGADSKRALKAGQAGRRQRIKQLRAQDKANAELDTSVAPQAAQDLTNEVVSIKRSIAALEAGAAVGGVMDAELVAQHNLAPLGVTADMTKREAVQVLRQEARLAHKEMTGILKKAGVDPTVESARVASEIIAKEGLNMSAERRGQLQAAIDIADEIASSKKLPTNEAQIAALIKEGTRVKNRLDNFDKDMDEARAKFDAANKRAFAEVKGMQARNQLQAERKEAGQKEPLKADPKPSSKAPFDELAANAADIKKRMNQLLRDMEEMLAEARKDDGPESELLLPALYTEADLELGELDAELQAIENKLQSQDTFQAERTLTEVKPKTGIQGQRVTSHLEAVASTRPEGDADTVIRPKGRGITVGQVVKAAKRELTPKELEDVTEALGNDPRLPFAFTGKPGIEAAIAAKQAQRTRVQGAMHDMSFLDPQAGGKALQTALRLYQRSVGVQFTGPPGKPPTKVDDILKQLERWLAQYPDAMRRINAEMSAEKPVGETTDAAAVSSQPKLTEKNRKASRGALKRLNAATYSATMQEYLNKEDPARIQGDQATVKQWAKALGVPAPRILDTSEWIELTDALPGEAQKFLSGSWGGATYNLKNGSQAIYLNPTFPPLAHAEVLAHEMGHVVYQKEFDTLSIADQTAVRDEFMAWRARFNKDSTGVRSVFQTRSPMGTYQFALQMHTGTVDSLAPEDRQYLFDFEEWFAESTAKWLTTSAKPRSIVEKFFAQVAVSIKKLVHLLQTKNVDYVPKSVEAYLDQQWNSEAHYEHDQFQDYALPTIEVEEIFAARPPSESPPPPLGSTKKAVPVETAKPVSEMTDKERRELELGRIYWDTDQERLFAKDRMNRHEGRPPHQQDPQYIQDRKAEMDAARAEQVVLEKKHGVKEIKALSENYANHFVAARQARLEGVLGAGEKTRADEIYEEAIEFMKTATPVLAKARIKGIVKRLKEYEESISQREDVPAGLYHAMRVMSAEEAALREWLSTEGLRQEEITKAGHYTPTDEPSTGRSNKRGPENLALTAAIGGTTAPSELRQAMHDLLRSEILTAQERLMLAKAFNAPVIARRIREAMKDDRVARLRLDDPVMQTMANIEYGYALWLTKQLTLSVPTGNKLQQLGVQAQNAMGFVQVQTHSAAILGAISNGTVQQHRRGTFTLTPNARNTILQQMVQAAMDGARTLKPAWDAMTKISDDRLRSTGIPALARLADMFHAVPGQKGPTETMSAGRIRQFGKFANRLHQIFPEDTDPKFAAEVLELLQTPGKVPASRVARTRRDQIRKLLAEVRAYALGAGVHMGHIDDFFPWVFDTDQLLKRPDAWVDFVSQEKFEPALKEFLIGPGDKYEFNRPMTAEERKEAARRIKTSITQANGVADLDHTKFAHSPRLDSANVRSLDFLRRLGNKADQETLASFFNKDLGHTVINYIEQTVKRAEYTRRMGVKDRRLNALLVAAQRQGATPEQMNDVRNYLHAQMGTLGAGIDPRLHKMQSWMMVYQNMRVLSTSLLGNISDVVGIGIRSGDWGIAWDAYKEGLKEIKRIVRKEGIGRSRQLAEDLGNIERHMVNESLGWEFGGVYMTDGAKRANELFFKYNGMAGWNRLNRVMAIRGAEKFIIKHAKTPSKHSARFLEELAIDAADVRTDSEGNLVVLTPLEINRLVGITRSKKVSQKAKDNAETQLLRNNRVEAALNRFVDTAILRPNASLRQTWASDPLYMSIYHLKGFFFAFHHIILKRAFTEAAQHKNFGPASHLLMLAPVAIAADMLRQTIIHAFDDEDDYNPRDQWTVTDWMRHGVQRSGIMGVHELWAGEYVGAPGGGGGGITPVALEQMIELAKSPFSDRPGSVKKELAQALPLQTLIRPWFDIGEQGPSGKKQVPKKVWRKTPRRNMWGQDISGRYKTEKKTFTGRVLKVFDADTVLMLTPSGEKETVRFANIDAPEKTQAGGMQARDFLAQMLLDQQIQVVSSGKGVHGRHIGTVLFDGEDINYRLISEGFAHYYSYKSQLSREERSKYIAAHDTAREANWGLWAQPAHAPSRDPSRLKPVREFDSILKEIFGSLFPEVTTS